MESIKDKIAVVGMGCTKFGENWDKSAEDMIIDAAYEAFEDAGIEPRDVQAAWVGTTTSGMTGRTVSQPLKLDHIPITRVENACATAMDAFRNACFGLLSGLYEVVLAVGFEKLKDSGLSGLPGGSDHPVWGKGSSFPGEFALVATRYFHQYGIDKETLARIAVKNHRNGALNPKAHFQSPITVEQALKAPIIAWPLGLFDCCPTTDGAAAAVLTKASVAKKFRDDPVLVKALALSVGPGTGYLRSDYDFTHFSENLAAAKQAYDQADIKDPLKEIDLAEVHDCFTITELVIYEDLGFCARGQGKQAVEEGRFELEGELAVNPDGGLKSFGHPVGASGLRMIYECYKQLQGKAGKRQIKNPRLALAHNLGGSPGGGFACSVAILGN